MSALDALLDSLPRVSLVVGKGGVGKTTCAAGIAAAFADRVRRTLLISTDPAAGLQTVLEAPATAVATPMPGRDQLELRQLVASELRKEFLDRWRSAVAEIVDRGTYLDRVDVEGLVDAALPGGDEIFAMLGLAEVLSDSTYERIVVDTAPTGHTLRLLALPDTFRALISMLGRMQEKHRFMVRTLTRRYRRDRTDDFLDEMRERIERLSAALTDPATTAAVVITRREPVVRAETGRLVERLGVLRVAIAAVIVNAASSLAEAAQDLVAPDVPHCTIGRQNRSIVGIEGARQLLETITEGDTPGTSTQAAAPTADAPPRRAGGDDLAALVRRLTIVGGKGGVGKTTVAAALALAAADALAAEGHGRVLLVSTDPAPSLADAFGESDAAWAHEDVEQILDGVPVLTVRQMDAGAAFARVRHDYQSRIDEVFESLTGGLDTQKDREILRELLALAPPGIDEVYGLTVLGDPLTIQRFTHVIVDPAPTGHLLRLLEMPAIALDWTHRLMRLMLKYQEIVGLGDAGRDLLEFAKRTRGLDALFRDHARAAFILVALDEPGVRRESELLATAVQARDIDLTALVWNRASVEPRPLPTHVTERQVLAPEVVPSPVGIRALREWSASWRLASTSR